MDLQKTNVSRYIRVEIKKDLAFARHANKILGDRLQRNEIRASYNITIGTS